MGWLACSPCGPDPVRYYASQKRQAKPQLPGQKRGPKRLSDEEVLVQIRQVLAESVFAARRLSQGIGSPEDEGSADLEGAHLAFDARGGLAFSQSPAGSSGRAIRTRAAFCRWNPIRCGGTDATATTTIEDGKVTIFAAIDHYSADCPGIHAVKKGHRFEALEPIRQAVGELFGAFTPGAAAGIRLRHDHSSVYMSEDFQNEIK